MEMVKHNFLSLSVEHKPSKTREGDACYDVRAHIEYEGNITIGPGKVEKVPLGFKVACHPGYEMQVRARSGLASKGIMIANSPGCVDESWRGECCALVYNSTDRPFIIENKNRIAQICFVKMAEDTLHEVDEQYWDLHLANTVRGESGFGSSGI